MAAHLVVDLGSDGAHDWLGQMCQDVGTALPTSRDNSWPKLEFQRPENQQIFSLAGITGLCLSWVRVPTSSFFAFSSFPHKATQT